VQFAARVTQVKGYKKSKKQNSKLTDLHLNQENKNVLLLKSVLYWRKAAGWQPCSSQIRGSSLG